MEEKEDFDTISTTLRPDLPLTIEDCIRDINVLMDHLKQKFNYKQRYHYRLKDLKFIATPNADETNITVDLVAFGYKEDKKILHQVTTCTASDVSKLLHDGIAELMRWGLREMLIRATVVSDDAYL